MRCKHCNQPIHESTVASQMIHTHTSSAYCGGVGQKKAEHTTRAEPKEPQETAINHSDDGDYAVLITVLCKGEPTRLTTEQRGLTLNRAAEAYDVACEAARLVVAK
jgi:hypothetical protein